MRRSVWIGYDPREAEAFAVCRDTAKRQLTQQISVKGIVLDVVRERGLYTRETLRKETTGQSVLWDAISGAPMATEFAISRFLIGQLAGSGYAMFMDCDILVRGNLARLFDHCEQRPGKAVWCVKHEHRPEAGAKMDGQVQTQYPRKNWSSVMVWNVDHSANRALTVDMINGLPGRDLHAFCWLDDSDIGSLDVEWNWLVGHSDPLPDPKLVHFTSGGPWMRGYEDVPYADAWRNARDRWAQ